MELQELLDTYAKPYMTAEQVRALTSQVLTFICEVEFETIRRVLSSCYDMTGNLTRQELKKELGDITYWFQHITVEEYRAFLQKGAEEGRQDE